MAPLLVVVDQALYALSNLVLQVIVARSVLVEEFGAYSVAANFLFVAALVQQAGIIEPMFVFSRQRYSDAMVAYHRRLRRGWSVAIGAAVFAIGIGIALVLLCLGSSRVAEYVAAFAVVSPLTLYMWLLRRMAIVLGRIELAVLGGAIYAGTLLGMAGSLWYAGRMSAVLSIYLTGVASGLGSVGIAFLFPQSTVRTAPPADMVHQHLRYGRWAVGSEAVSFLVSGGVIVALPAWFSLSAVAEFRVVQLLFMPLLQIVSALTVLLLRRFAALGHGSDVATVLKYVWLLVAGATLYSAIAITFGVTLAPKIFGPQYYVESLWMMLGAAWASLFVMSQGFFTALRAREQSHRVLLVYLVVLLVMAATLPLMAKSGVAGILAAQTIAWSFAVPLAGVLVLRARAPTFRQIQQSHASKRDASGSRPDGVASAPAADPAHPCSCEPSP